MKFDKALHRVEQQEDGMYRPQERGLFGWKSWGDDIYGPVQFTKYEDAINFLARRRMRLIGIQA